MPVHVASRSCSHGLFQFISTFLFLSIARINLNRDKLLNRKVMWKLEKKWHRRHMWSLVCLFLISSLHNATDLHMFFSTEKIEITCSCCVKWILKDKIFIRFFFNTFCLVLLCFVSISLPAKCNLWLNQLSVEWILWITPEVKQTKV